MGESVREYRVTGPVEAGAGPGAALADLGIGAALGILAWPFPVARIGFQQLAGSVAGGWAVHVPVLLVFLALCAWLYATACIVAMRRTFGMYFADLGFEAPPRPAAAAAFSARWVAGALAALVRVPGPAAVLASRALGSTLVRS